VHAPDENGETEPEGDDQSARSAVGERFRQHRPDPRAPEKEESQAVTIVYRPILSSRTSCTVHPSSFSLHVEEQLKRTGLVFLTSRRVAQRPMFIFINVPNFKRELEKDKK